MQRKAPPHACPGHLHAGSAHADAAIACPVRPAAVPPFGRLLRGQRADVLSSQGAFRVGAHDVLLGTVEDCPFYVGAAQFPYWEHCELTLDVTTGGGDSFSLEAADGVPLRRPARALFTDSEAAELAAAGKPPTRPRDLAAIGASVG